jgi:archaetidylinositol phosphate synthase
MTNLPAAHCTRIIQIAQCAAGGTMTSPALIGLSSPTSFRNATRLQESFLAASEKRLLIRMAEHTPSWITSDHLTILGFAAQLMTGFSYALARGNGLWLLTAIAFLVLNWFGDSMDGTLARVRQKQRPRYGFYVDHMLDSIGAVVLMGGLAASGYMSPAIAVSLLVLFLLLSIQSYLATYTLGEFRMSFWSFGPTELRLLLIAGNLALFRWPVVLGGYRLFDVGGAIGIAGMAAIFLWFTARNIRRLYREERIA